MKPGGITWSGYITLARLRRCIGIALAPLGIRIYTVNIDRLWGVDEFRDGEIEFSTNDGSARRNESLHIKVHQAPP